MNTQKRYNSDFKERAVRLVDEHVKSGQSQWASMQSISRKLGCTPETLQRWVRRVERDAGKRPALTSEERERLKKLERENRQLRRANEILRRPIMLDVVA